MSGQPQPYYADDRVQLYHGDMREVLPALGTQADACVTDPPYAETSLAWDRWPDGWPALVAQHTSSMWCFGSMRMFLDRRDEFDGWKLSQDIVWEKNSGSGIANDRFRRIHEHAVHWYRGAWRDVHHETVRVAGFLGAHSPVPASGAPPHLGAHIGPVAWTDDGTRMQRSVIKAKKIHRVGIHPTEKPSAILTPLIEYACPAGGIVLDPFAGSASTLFTARMLGRRAIGIEGHEPYCERAAERLSDLFGGVA
jgi:site-specific DNA-methyltransferase (adenine-specific)